MVKLISIHIPKTAGTSFYNILTQVYGEKLSIYYRRRDLKILDISQEQHEVVHGHFHFQEVRELHQKYKPKIICWLREPVDRLISKYFFFIEGLRNPNRNPVQYELNKHRIDEDILTFASREETQNTMSKFLKGMETEDFFFIGQMEHFERDLKELATKLNWPPYYIPQLNKGKKSGIDQKTRDQIRDWNLQDIELYNRLIQK